MTPSELQALEKIQIGDIKSAMDQIKYLIIKNNEAQVNINKIYNALDEKVNLKSKLITVGVPILEIGSGTVSATLSTVTGTGTLFTREFIVGNSIKIGTEIIAVASITSDTLLTVDFDFDFDYTDQVYGIEKIINPEVLTGNFNFGVTNGDIFNGIVNQGSILQHYGRMTNDYDVINVQYAKRLSTPAMIRAANSILRTGDYVGPDTIASPSDKYTYNFQNIVWTFDTSVQAYYAGAIDQADTDQARLSFINRGYVDLKLANFDSAMRASYFGANWINENQTGIAIASVAGATIVNLFNTAPTNLVGNMSTYFTPSTSGLQCIKECTILVSVNGFKNDTSTRNGESGCFSLIAKDSVLISKSVDLPTHSDMHGSAATIATSCFAVVNMVAGEKLLAGIGSYGIANILHSYISISLLR